MTQSGIQSAFVNKNCLQKKCFTKSGGSSAMPTPTLLTQAMFTGARRRRLRMCETRGTGLSWPTVPQKGVVFVKFQLFPKCFFSVCMIILGYCTHVFSIRTFYISIYEQNRDISIFWWPKIVKIVTFFWNLPVFF